MNQLIMVITVLCLFQAVLDSPREEAALEEEEQEQLCRALSSAVLSSLGLWLDTCTVQGVGPQPWEAEGCSARAQASSWLLVSHPRPVPLSAAQMSACSPRNMRPSCGQLLSEGQQGWGRRDSLEEGQGCAHVTTGHVDVDRRSSCCSQHSPWLE